MNTKIQNMKIANYKKQILEQFASYTILDIFHGEELQVYSEFYQRISLLEEVRRKRFGYYNPDTHEYLDDAIPYAKAFEYFITNSSMFYEEESVIYFIQYHEEYFGLKVLFQSSLLATMQQFNRKNLLVVNENQTKLLALDFLEYEIEVLAFDCERD
ncbi:Uncharacterised protein [Myroides odoratus]|uniref:Uncharacterized protein n=2 Tax=Myroides odoratus TaxID=256 RepID=A0A9Q7E7X3_MYROD|nr:hypothetical protein Myrod_1768 [Myroides odoratus DSM 2801]EKB07842.1 hypothetical protein HMPREF9716_01625 [Myroides odoratus CIP 103059]QQT99970.1 hypothetical protein I6I88_17690 [Myroides odoratus]STZ29863.1 Uncharacterised protein [Myroides odoratus]